VKSYLGEEENHEGQNL